MVCENCGNELIEGSLFCNKCGVKVSNNVSKAPKFSVKFIKITSLAILVVGLILAALYINLKSPVRLFKSAINKNDYVEAARVYKEEIMNTSEEEKINDFLKSRVDEIKKDYLSKKVTYEESIQVLETIRKSGLINTYVKEAIDEIKLLNASRVAFDKANEYERNNNIIDAIKEFNNVIESDENYSIAQKKIKNLEAEYKEHVLNEIELKIQDKEYDRAISLIEEATSILSEDAELATKKDLVFKTVYEKLKDEQLVTVEKASIVEQSSEFKALWPDMIQVIIRNNSNKVIRDFWVSCVAYDKNKLPVKIKGNWDFSNGDFEFVGYAENVNVVPNATFGKGMGWELDDPHNISTVLACVKEVEFYDDTTWENPYYDFWIEKYKNKPLE